MVDTLPIFEGYDHDRLRTIGQTVFDLFTEEDGLDALFGLMRDALPDSLRETAYALCCDVAAADGHAFQAELQFLLELRHELEIDRLHAAAIERGSAARHRRLPTRLKRFPIGRHRPMVKKSRNQDSAADPALPDRLAQRAATQPAAPAMARAEPRLSARTRAGAAKRLRARAAIRT